MKNIIRRLYAGFRIQLRILKLHFIKVPEPEDAKSAEQMAKEIKEALKLT